MPELPSLDPAATLPWLSHVIRKVQALRFGSVQIKIHEGQVVVVESLEQKRFHPAPKDGEAKPAPNAKKPPAPKP
jgi:hypothetical protein